MKHLLIIVLLISSYGIAAQYTLPNQSTSTELQKENIKSYKYSYNTQKTKKLPPVGNLRTMAEWEETQSVCITWTGYKSILAQIVDATQVECEVIILCTSASSALSELNGYGVSATNVTFIEDDFNSIWMRDYGGNTVYKDYVDSLILVDWIYNRSRPDDNSAPEPIGIEKNIDVYEMSQAPYDLVHTGGNFMADGFGTAFSSKLVDDENSASGNYNLTVKSSSEVDDLMESWMGIDTYIKMDVLPYDDIHHIDMHMKLLDEETLLIGEFPTNTSDGPYIEANIQYIQNNFNSVFGTPFKIIRIPMPSSTTGGYPNGNWGGASYRTYANNLIVNKSILLPTYREKTDTTGIRILQEAMPGYTIVPIDVDDNGANLIGAGGAIHCITKEIGVEDPLLISHQSLVDTYDDANPYIVEGLIMHRSNISSASLFYKIGLSGTYSSVTMSSIGNDNWSASIPAQQVGSEIYYYISATSVSGKSQVRPITAPDGYFHFEVLGSSVSVEESNVISLGRVFPNPSSALTCIELNNSIAKKGSIEIYSYLGEKIESIFEGTFPAKNYKYFVDVSNYASGIYSIVVKTESQVNTTSLMVK